MQMYELSNFKFCNLQGIVVGYVLRYTTIHTQLYLFQYFALSEVSSTMGHGDLGRLHFRIPF